jgi:hypothetical protein
MFGFGMSKLKKLEKKHKQVLEEAFTLSKTDRKASDAKYAEAQEIENEIMELKND